MFSLAAKRLCILLVSVCAMLPASADWALRPQADAKLQQAIDYSLAFSANTGMERNRTFGSLGYHWTLAPYEASVGFQNSGKVSDFTLSSAWWAVRSEHQWRVWEFGIESSYHYQHYENVYGEHDFIVCYCLRQKRDNGFELLLKNGVTLKAANIYTIDGAIVNRSTVGMVQAGKTWRSGFELYTSAGSHDTFRYPLFFSPRFIVGTAFTFGGIFRPSVEFEVGFTDFFATAVYVNTLLVRLTGRVLL